jgi:uncharacterized protein YukE
MALIDYPDFLTTDTMNQQVTKLVDLVADVDSNNTNILTTIQDFREIFNSTTVTWDYVGTVTTQATGVVFNTSSLFDVNTATLDITASDSATLTGSTIKIDAVGESGDIVLESNNNLSNVTLKSNGTTYGILRNNGDNLTIRSGDTDMIILNAQTLDATFSGTITLPSASVNTTAKDVAGAINELEAMIVALQNQVTALQEQVNNL